MSEPIVGTNNSLVTDLQSQSQSSGLITVFEVILPDSDIGGAGVDKLYFHDGTNGTANITWYSLNDETNFGSTEPKHYGVQTYSAFPVESEGWEVRGTGSQPRPTVRFANLNQFWSAHLSNYDDLVGAKVIRRKTLQKYMGTNPPVEFNRDVYYIERKMAETGVMVEFELVTAFDVQGVKLPRRQIISARCPWKYKDTEQGGCDWPADNRYTIDSTEHTLYFDKDDNRVTSYATWGRQDLTANRKNNLYAATSYSVGDYVEYHRPIGGIYPVVEKTSDGTTGVVKGTNETTLYFSNAPTRDIFSVGDFVILKGFDHANNNYKSIPVYVKAKGSGTTYSITVEDDDSADSNAASILHSNTDPDFDGTYEDVYGYVQATRVTLYKCTTAHSIATSDDADDIIKPTNISYWEFGDVCGKRLNSCAIRYGHEPALGKVARVKIDMVNGVAGGGSGYSSATVAFSGGGAGVTTTAAANATVSGGKVAKVTLTNHGVGYTTVPTVTISGDGSGATATAELGRDTRNVGLPFGGFPGAALY